MVFGRVVSGQPVVMQIEELGVDNNSRPLQDAKVVKCGELVLKSKIKGKFFLKNKLRFYKVTYPDFLSTLKIN